MQPQHRLPKILNKYNFYKKFIVEHEYSVTESVENEIPFGRR